MEQLTITADRAKVNIYSVLELCPIMLCDETTGRHVLGDILTLAVFCQCGCGLFINQFFSLKPWAYN